jgi:hypothetical protein
VGIPLAALALEILENSEQCIEGVGAEVLGPDDARNGDGEAHLLEVGATRGTIGEMRFEASSVATRQFALEVIPDEADRLTAINVLHQRSH